MPARAIAAWGSLTLTLLAGVSPESAEAQESIVRAVLFYSPTCPHCAAVIRDVLPGLFTRFGGQPRFYQGQVGHVVTNGRLEVLLVNASQPEGHALYETSTVALNVPPERGGVPRLVCGDTVLVGSLEIPEQFPQLIAEAIAGAGLDWPPIDGLARALPVEYARSYAGDPRIDSTAGAAPPPPAAAESSAAPASGEKKGPSSAPAPSLQRDSPTPRTAPEGAGVAAEPPPAAPEAWPVPPAEGSTLGRTLRTDPIGGALALGMLGAMLFSMGLVFAGVGAVVPPAWDRVVPALVAVGMAIAGYLAYVESTGAVAVCGPVGDCNAVQQSQYARLGGIPMAAIGLAGYALILAAWILARVGPEVARLWATLAAFGLSVVGTVASTVLTVLEPFVIGAVCSWCLASAALMTLLLWVLARPATEIARAVRGLPPRWSAGQLKPGDRRHAREHQH